MPVRIGTGLSTLGDPKAAAIAAATEAGRALGDRSCDLAVIFVSGAHLARPGAMLEGVHEALAPAGLVGCGSAGVIAQARGLQDTTAIAVWAAAFGGGRTQTFHATAAGAADEDADLEVDGLVDLDGAAGALLLADPYTFPTPALLARLSAAHPRLPLIGGLASAHAPGARTPLFIDDRVVDSGAVGARFDGVRISQWVSHGAVPVGPELTITAAEGKVVSELAGQPALLKLRETVAKLEHDEQQLVRDGLLVGIVVDANKPEYVQGDFLVRGLVGADPDTNEITIGSTVRPGQVLRLHVRDAASADRDLRRGPNRSWAELRGERAGGALLISCNGRGTSLFGSEHHDAQAVHDQLGGIPIAGFFAAGEIGPAGSGSFLHSLTATVAVFG